MFKSEFGKAFGKPDYHKQQAREKLSPCFQVPTESSMAYVEDVLHICHWVDDAMSLEEKLHHLFTGHSLF